MAASATVPRPAHVPPERVVEFDYYEPPGVQDGFQEAWRSLQAEGVPDVVWSPYNGGHWIATRGALVKEVFADHARFSNRVILVPKAIGELHQMLPTTLDPPAHRPVRRLLDHSLSPRAVVGLEAVIRDIALELVQQLAPRGHCDLLADYAAHFPIRVFMHMVDLPAADAPRLKAWTDQVIHPDGSMSYAQALQHFHDYLVPVIEARRGAGGDDALSYIVNARLEAGDLDTRELLNLLTQFLMGGLDTVYNFLAYAFLFLARSPTHRGELVRDPSRIGAAVDELLRRFPLVSTAREVRADMDFAGVTLKRGEMIVCASPLVGLDATLNPDPLRVDFTRRRAEHASFGKGIHACPGAHLARSEMRITLQTWLAHIPDFGLAPDAVVRHKGGIVGSIDCLPLVWALPPGAVRAP